MTSAIVLYQVSDNMLTSRKFSLYHHGMEYKLICNCELSSEYKDAINTCSSDFLQLCDYSWPSNIYQ